MYAIVVLNLLASSFSRNGEDKDEEMTVLAYLFFVLTCLTSGTGLAQISNTHRQRGANAAGVSVLAPAIDLSNNVGMIVQLGLAGVISNYLLLLPPVITGCCDLIIIVQTLYYTRYVHRALTTPLMEEDMQDVVVASA